MFSRLGLGSGFLGNVTLRIIQVDFLKSVLFFFLPGHDTTIFFPGNCLFVHFAPDPGDGNRGPNRCPDEGDAPA